jgi:hypothetical protein
MTSASVTTQNSPQAPERPYRNTLDRVATTRGAYRISPACHNAAKHSIEKGAVMDVSATKGSRR